MSLLSDVGCGYELLYRRKDRYFHCEGEAAGRTGNKINVEETK